MTDTNVLKPWFNASGTNDGTCVDVQFLAGGGVQIRNSNATETVIDYTPQEWEKFVHGVKVGKFDLPTV